MNSFERIIIFTKYFTDEMLVMLHSLSKLILSPFSCYSFWAVSSSESASDSLEPRLDMSILQFFYTKNQYVSKHCHVSMGLISNISTKNTVDYFENTLFNKTSDFQARMQYNYNYPLSMKNVFLNCAEKRNEIQQLWFINISNNWHCNNLTCVFIVELSKSISQWTMNPIKRYLRIWGPSHEVY